MMITAVLMILSFIFGMFCGTLISIWPAMKRVPRPDKEVDKDFTQWMQKVTRAENVDTY